MPTQYQLLINQQSALMEKQSLQIACLNELLNEATIRANMNLENSRRWKEKYFSLQQRVDYCKEQL